MAVGAPRPDWSEIDPKIWQTSQVYVDSLAGAQAESGDIINSKCEIQSELGTFIGQKGQTKTTQRTIFKSLGLAVEDLVAAKMVFEKSKNASKCPLTFIKADKANKAMNVETVETQSEVSTTVKNFDAKAILVNSQLLICEIKTHSTSLCLLYKATTGELLAFIDLQDLQNCTLSQRLAYYENLRLSL